MSYKEDFPIFKNNPGLIYLDNAAISQRPSTVIQVESDFSSKENSNVNRGIYKLSELALKKYTKARKTIANFLNALTKEIIYTKNTTESLNLLAYTIDSIIPKDKDEIVITEMEHHSNLIPWQQLCKRKNYKLKIIKTKDDFTLDYEDAKSKITNKTALVTLCHISNTLGTINDIEKIISLAKENNALTIIDAAQSASHKKIDVKKLDCDFLALSSHKMLGPTGIGILYGKLEILEKLNPFLFGGGMISDVSYENATWNDLPEKFEAGTQNISSTIAFGEAINYLNKITFKKIQEIEKELLKYALENLQKIENIEIYNPGLEKSSSLISFNLKGIHPHDVASLLDDYHVCVRAGHHCTMPLMKKLQIPGTIRASFAFYNTKEDIDELIKALQKIQGIFTK